MGFGIVGNQVWVAVANGGGGYRIDRYNFDGTSAGASITGNGLANPVSIKTIGNQVWVANNSNGSISRFNLDGTSAGSPITGMAALWDLALIP